MSSTGGQSRSCPEATRRRRRGAPSLAFRGALLLALVPGIALMNGCGLVEWITNGFEVGPDYVEPDVSTAPQWIDYQDSRVKAEPADLSSWWKMLGDPALDSLVEKVLAQNLTLRAAAERIANSRAQKNVAFGNLFPQEQYAFGDLSYNHASEETANPPLDDSFTSWDLGGAIAWELDFWGKYRRALQAAEAELDASVANYDDIVVLLLSEVAANYVLCRTYQERLSFVRANVEIQRKSFEIVQDKFKAGAATERDTHMARQILEESQARIPELEAGLRQAQNALCLLQGIPPRDLSDVLGNEGKIPQVQPQVALGIPADLVRRRPDVRRAERIVAAQSALIGVAKSDFYPHLSVLGSIGFQAEHLSHLFTSDAITGSIGPSFRWDVLHYGRILNTVRAQEASFREAALAYQEAVLRAGKEAEDSVEAFLKAQEKAASLAESAKAATRVVEITLDQYQQGAVDYMWVCYFMDKETDQEDRLAAARGEIALNMIAVYRSLGGGWETRLAGAKDAGAAPGGASAPKQDG